VSLAARDHARDDDVDAEGTDRDSSPSPVAVSGHWSRPMLLASSTETARLVIGDSNGSIGGWLTGSSSAAAPRPIRGVHPAWVGQLALWMGYATAATGGDPGSSRPRAGEPTSHFDERRHFMRQSRQ
jgi:hypothetical protein